MEPADMSNAHDGFKRGGKGVFACNSCGVNTRATAHYGQDGICEDCEELSGMENGVADGCPVADYLAESVERYQHILKRGGTFDFWTDLGPAVHAAIAEPVQA